MNKTRKILSVIMACVVMLFATACGKDNTPFTHGKWSGNTYSSEFFGIKVQLGSDWVVVSDADLAKNAGAKDMSDSSIQSLFAKGRSIYEMMAAKPNGSSVIITVQDTDKNTSLTEKVFYDLGVPYIKQSYTSQGYKCDISQSKVIFLDKNTDCIELALSKDNKTLYCCLFPVFKSHYTALILFGSLSKPELYSMLAMANKL